MTHAPEVIEVWQIPLGRPTHGMERLLSAEERDRADRFVTAPLRRRYVIAHAVLRTLLGTHLGIDPVALRFRHGPFGKPALEGLSLQFNLSHSHEMAMVAISADHELGVDIEFVRDLEDAHAIARSTFSALENQTLAKLPQFIPGFFACWTRKEALIKGVGDGLQLPLDRFDVAVCPDRPAQLIASRLDPDVLAGWQLTALKAPAGYTGALAVRGSSPWTLRELEF